MAKRIVIMNHDGKSCTTKDEFKEIFTIDGAFINGEFVFIDINVPYDARGFSEYYPPGTTQEAIIVGNKARIL